jgi:hypothetical protein
MTGAALIVTRGIGARGSTPICRKSAAIHALTAGAAGTMIPDGDDAHGTRPFRPRSIGRSVHDYQLGVLIYRSLAAAKRER